MRDQTEQPIPRVVSKAGPPNADHGVVRSTVEHGEVFLRSKQETLRLRWSPGDTEVARAVAVGVYRVFGYRVVKGDWFVSATGGDRKLEVRGDSQQDLTLEGKIALKLRVQRKDQKVRIQLGISSGEGMGLSLYKEGKRVGLRYSVLNASGAALAEGPLDYG